MSPDDELSHVLHGVAPDESFSGTFVASVRANCAGDAEMVLDRCRQIMSAVVSNSFGPWPEPRDWETLLPDWFVAKAAPRVTLQAADEWLATWRTMQPHERALAERNVVWDLENWLYSMEPEQREWRWWDAQVVSPDQVQLSLELDDAHAALGAFEWLVRAAGAQSVETD